MTHMPLGTGAHRTVPTFRGPRGPGPFSGRVSVAMRGTARSTHEDLTVAVIHYQTPELLSRCLPLVRTAAPKAQILVIDTSERDPLEPGDMDPTLGARLISQRNHSYAAA